MLPAAKSKLSKIGMPSKKKALDDGLMIELEMDGKHGTEGSPEEEAGESDEEASAEGDSDNGDMANEMAGESEGEGDGESADVQLSEASDDELMSELRKRGLASKAMSASKKPSDDSEY